LNATAAPAAAPRRAARPLAGATVAIALHAVVIVALLQLDPVRSAVTAAMPITVSLLSPPKPVVEPEVKPKPLPPKPKPRVVRPKPAPKPPVVTAAPEAPTERVVPPAPPEPLPPIEIPVPVAAAPAPAPVAEPPAPPPPPLVPPSFNAAYLNNPAPVYPSLSRRMGEEGRVMLRVHVSEQGTATQVQLRTSSKHPRLDEAALEAVRRWRFVPARRGDQPVAAWVLVPISFSLRS
jgi:protein TonB